MSTEPMPVYIVEALVGKSVIRNMISEKREVQGRDEAIDHAIELKQTYPRAIVRLYLKEAMEYI